MSEVTLHKAYTGYGWRVYYFYKDGCYGLFRTERVSIGDTCGYGYRYRVLYVGIGVDIKEVSQPDFPVVYSTFKACKQAFIDSIEVLKVNHIFN